MISRGCQPTDRLSNRKSKIAFWILVFASWPFFSCEPSVESIDYEEKLVVFGNLEANFPIIDTFFVSRSYVINEAHEGSGKWAEDAIVTIRGGSDSVMLRPVPGAPGRYLDLDTTFIALPGTTYYLDVSYEDYRVTASTTAPTDFSLQSIDSYDWECNGEPVWVSPIDLHEEENRLAILKAVVLDSLEKLLYLPMDTVVYREGPCYSTSFASVPMFLVEWEAETEPGMMRVTSIALDDTVSNAIIDTSFSANAFKGPMYMDEDGNYYRPNPLAWNLSQPILDFGWLTFNYYGPHLILMQATDQAFRDYFEGDPLRQNQYILPNSNIEGGYGLFSSTMTRFFLVYVAADSTKN